MTAALLEVRGLWKSYPGVDAVREVSLELAPDRITALLGENGAGKSTLIRLLSGSEEPDRGSMRLDGQTYAPSSPAAALRHGVSTLYQEQTLLDQRSVADNVLLGRESYRGLLADRRRNFERTRAALVRVGASHIDPRTSVGELPLADRQMVDIARALERDSRLLILDEPTAALSAGEVEALFRVLRTLPGHGVSVLLVSHRLDEIFAICSDVVVLRDGAHVLSASLADLDADRLVSAMVGEDVVTTVPSGSATTGKVLLQASGLSGPGFSGVDLEVRAGEILGLTGITGSGKEQLAQVLYGGRPQTGGTIHTVGRPARRRLTPRQAIASGVVGVPGDRVHEGVVPALSVAQNLTLPSLQQLSRIGFLRPSAVKAMVRERVQQLAIKTPSGATPVAQLSGGNQQKVALGKWLQRSPSVLVLVEPTQGIDVKVRYEFYRLIRTLSDSGTGVVLVSSDLPEVRTLADVVIVLRHGQVVGRLSGAEATAERLVRLSFGQAEPARPGPE